LELANHFPTKKSKAEMIDNKIQHLDERSPQRSFAPSAINCPAAQDSQPQSDAEEQTSVTGTQTNYSELFFCLA
jgi:hypothetical protein